MFAYKIYIENNSKDRHNVDSVHNAIKQHVLSAHLTHEPPGLLLFQAPN